MLSSNNLLTDLKQSSFLFFLLCVVALAAISKPAYAQISDFKIIPSDGAASDFFGTSVAISGDYAVVGPHPRVKQFPWMHKVSIVLCAVNIYDHQTS